MSSGRRSTSARVRAPAATALGALAVVAGLALGGCAGVAPGIERDVERRAALDRWTRCIERHVGVAAPSEVRARLAHGCEGHRRDVLRAFPPRSAPRLERLMNERTETVLRTRLRGEERLHEADEPLLERALEALSAG